MNLKEAQCELLLRCLEGRVLDAERAQALELLRNDGEARAFLREVAEQSVMVSELERIAAGHQQERGAIHAERKIVPVNFFTWRRVAAAAVLLVLGALAVQFLPRTGTPVARVSRVTGIGQYFGAKGGAEHPLRVGSTLAAGDTLETRSCDAWIELKLRGGGALTLAGQSSLRVLEADKGREQFRLLHGALWGSPAAGATGDVVRIQTPTLSTELRGAQFDIQTSATETMLRVNAGSARARQALDGSSVGLTRGQQVAASLNRQAPLAVTMQPAPIDYWAFDLWRVPEVILGKWLPPTPTERARLGAEPLLWPVSERDSVMLYTVALAAWKSTENPVRLQSNSKLLVRGRTERAQMVRFGFSAQRMRGVFAGKFETDVQPTVLGPAGQTWQVEIPLQDFRPLQPQLSASPDGLELTDIYALTIRDDAGLEINHVELVPWK